MMFKFVFSWKSLAKGVVTNEGDALNDDNFEGCSRCAVILQLTHFGLVSVRNVVVPYDIHLAGYLGTSSQSAPFIRSAHLP
jgi:hypothetical protein